MIKQILKSLKQRITARKMLNAIRICEKHLPNDKFRPAVKAILAIYYKDYKVYLNCLNELKHISKHKERKND